MSLTTKITTVYNTAEGNICNVVDSITNDSEISFDGSIAGTTTNELVDIAFAKATMQAVCMTSDQAVIVKTNSASSPGNTFTFTANSAITWSINSVYANPFAGDVTALYVSNPGSAAASFKVRVLEHLGV